jgi:hypothetical protein
MANVIDLRKQHERVSEENIRRLDKKPAARWYESMAREAALLKALTDLVWEQDRRALPTDALIRAKELLAREYDVKF